MTDPSKQIPALRDQAFLFLHSCPDYAVVLDNQWSVIYANPAFQEKFGAAGAGGDFLAYLDLASANMISGLQLQLFQAPRQVDLKLLTGDSKALLLQYSFFPLITSDSHETLLAGIGRDRTADMALLSDVIELNLTLEQKQKELSDANSRLEQLALIDQTTELYNRHYFFQVAQHFWEESKRYGFPMVAIMMDIDNFKSVNDTYGHLFGDQVLKQIAFRLRNNTRKSDVLARYGGEELILIASNTDMLTGLVLAERLRSTVAAEPFVMGTCSASITISLGVSGTELADFPTFETLLDSSDHALYGAKHAGKNCVYTYSDLNEVGNPELGTASGE